MTQIDEPNLDEQIEDILNFLDEKSHQSLGYDATVQAIKQLIDQARIDEVYYWFDKEFVDKGSKDMTIGHTMKQVKDRIAGLKGE